MPNNEPLFSVIVCCYNPDLGKLKETIISIIKQKKIEFEIIISDDGSKIDFFNDIKCFCDSLGILNIKYNFLKQNVGTVKNIISALKISKGIYSKVISPGDYLYDENSLKNYYDVFIKQNADLVFGKAVYYSIEDEILDRKAPLSRFTYNKYFVNKNVLVYKDYILGASIACKTALELEFLEEIENDVRLVEDYPLTALLIVNNYKLAASKENLIWYECGLGVSTQMGSFNILNKDFVSFDKYLDKEYSENKLVKKSLAFKSYNLDTKKLKFFKYLFKFPDFYLYKVGRLFHYKNSKKINIVNKNKFIKID